MISAPRINPRRCPAGCTCPVCIDDLTAWVDVLATEPHPGDEWRAVNLKRPVPVEHHRFGVVDHVVDLAAFEQDMADLTRMVRWGATDRQGRPT